MNDLKMCQNKNTCLLKTAFFPAFCHVFTSSWSNVCLFSTFPNFFPPLLTTVAACLKFFPRQKAGARDADERRHIRVQKFLKGTTTNNPEVFLTLLSIHYLNPFSHATAKTKDAFASFYPLVQTACQWSTYNCT